MINYYSNGMLEYTFKKEVVAYLVKNGLPIRNLKQYKNNKYRYYLSIKSNKWLTTYYFSGADYNKYNHPKALDVRISYSRA